MSAQKSDCAGAPVDKLAVLPSRSVYVKSVIDGSVLWFVTVAVVPSDFFCCFCCCFICWGADLIVDRFNLYDKLPAILNRW